jgi:hypothetical protein
MKVSFTIAVLISALQFVSCDNDVQQSFRDYLPLHDGETKLYDVYLAEEKEDLSGNRFVQRKVSTLHDTLIDGVSYKLVKDSFGPLRAVRRNGSAYMQRVWEQNELAFLPEAKILDIAAPLGSKWPYDPHNGYSKATYTIRAKGISKTFLNKTFDDLIVVERQSYISNYQGGWDLWVTSWSYYAPGVGEVYSFTPYPLSYTYADLSALLVDQN